MSHVIEATLPAAPLRRPRLITPHGLVLVAATVAASLALLFPGLDFGHPRFLAHPDELSIAYLDQVLRQRPQDRPARLLLARQQLALGKWSEAEAHLHRLTRASVPEDAITWRARLALVELERAEVDALPAANPTRTSRQAGAVKELRRVAAAAPFDATELAGIAQMALALEAPGDAAAIYARLANQQPARRHEWSLLAPAGTGRPAACRRARPPTRQPAPPRPPRPRVPRTPRWPSRCCRPRTRAPTPCGSPPRRLSAGRPTGPCSSAASGWRWLRTTSPARRAGTCASSGWSPVTRRSFEAAGPRSGGRRQPGGVAHAVGPGRAAARRRIAAPAHGAGGVVGG